MTEQEWLECADARLMLEFLHGKASDRKLRLFAVACARLVGGRIAVATFQNAVEVAERFADGQATETELESASLYSYYREGGGGFAAVRAQFPDEQQDSVFPMFAIFNCTTFSPSLLSRLNMTSQWGQGERISGRQQPALLREVFGNHFRPVTVHPTWLTPTVVSLATAIYTDRAFDRLPILADALEDAGCDNADLLNHCRQPGDHVRGCWAVDLVLGKQ